MLNIPDVVSMCRPSRPARLRGHLLAARVRRRVVSSASVGAEPAGGRSATDRPVSCDTMRERPIVSGRPPRLTIRAGDLSELTVPPDMTGVRWADTTVECRARLLHPQGTLVAGPDDLGVVLTGAEVVCDICSDACAQ